MGVESITVGKAKVTLNHFNGEVLSYHKHSETHVRGGGGGPNNHYVSVHSSEITHTEVFIKDEAGREHQLMLKGEKGLALREGQKVTLAQATTAGKAPVYVYIYVHNTDTEYYLRQRLDVYQNRQQWHWVVLGFMILFFNYYMELDSWGWSIFWGLLSSFFIVMMITAKVLQPMALKELDKGIQTYMDSNDKEILKYSGQTL